MPPKIQFTQENIIETAFQIVRREGWKGLSARAIARDLNCSTRPIYDHLKSMKTLEEEVIKKTLEYFYEYLSSSPTGDIWLDQAVGHVRFAMEERHLFRCINDPEHASVQKKHTLWIWESLGKMLSDHELFEGLSEKEIARIRATRWFFIHGISSLISNEWFSVREADIHTELWLDSNISILDIVRIVNQVVYEGLKNDDILNALEIYPDENEKPGSGKYSGIQR